MNKNNFFFRILNFMIILAPAIITKSGSFFLFGETEYPHENAETYTKLLPEL